MVAVLHLSLKSNFLCEDPPEFLYEYLCMYVFISVGATELLANHFKAANGSLPLPIDFRDITPKNITELRTKIKLLIYKLAEDQ